MRTTRTLSQGWYFRRGDDVALTFSNAPDAEWQRVTIPHDWAIDGPFNGWAEPMLKLDKTGKVSLIHGNDTAGLPYMGCGTYIMDFTLPETESHCAHRLEFDGVMSHSAVCLNGERIGGRAYGYSSFALDVTGKLHFGLASNRLLVHVENPLYLSRWYPGAGLFRDVRLVSMDAEHLPWCGIQLLTKNLDLASKTATLRVHADGIPDSNLHVAVSRNNTLIAEGGASLPLQDLELWSPESPALYDVTVSSGSDAVTFRYGFRTLDMDPNSGLSLNGRPYRFRGLCMHHDLGVFGAAYNQDVMRWRLRKIKSLGCNALRMSHNPPAPQLLDLCDEMGFLVVDEAFDIWRTQKTPGDYHLDFETNHEQDLRTLIRRDRNHPCVALWSIGNEIPDDILPGGSDIARELVAICHDEDSTRLVTASINHQSTEDAAELHAFSNALDVLGYNYKPELYPLLHLRFPDKPMFGLETAAVNTSRGEYRFPVVEGPVQHARYSTAYATEHAIWTSSSETMFKALDDCPWIMGEFAWCTFDYLGEPFPFTWPNRSSCWGLFDLAGLIKDRAFLYAAQWHQPDAPHVLRLLPHWNWQTGQHIPVHVFTSCPAVELFLNGQSLGKKQRGAVPRIIWEDIPFVPGKLDAVGYDLDGTVLATARRQTAGPPAAITAAIEKEVRNDGAYYVFADVSVTDQNGIVLETADTDITLSVNGAILCGVDNGDACCLQPFRRNHVRLYNGHAMVTLLCRDSGTLTLSSQNLPATTLTP